MSCRQKTRRRGTVLIAVLVCMGFATVVLLGAVQTSLHQRRHMRQEMQMEQTRWLLDAGLSMGVARLIEKPEYVGETLALTPEFGKYTNAEVEITVIRDDESDSQFRLLVTAQLGSMDESDPVMKRSKEIVVENR